MIPQLRRFLLDNWTELPLGPVRPRDLHFLVQATGISKLCCFIFPGDADVPHWVAKLPRTPRDNKVLVHEYDIIQQLREQGSAFVRTTIPGPLFTTILAHHFVGIEEYLPGVAMDGLMMVSGDRREALVRDYLDLAIAWLLRCQRETMLPSGLLTDAQVQTHVLQPIAQLKTTARLNESELAYLDALVSRVADLRHLPLPLVFKHGDFQPGNILVAGRSLHVIDWEFGLSAALPLIDVFGFLARTYARSHGQEEMDGFLEDYIAAFEAVFFKAGPFAALTIEYIDRACRCLDIDPAWADLLFPLFMINEANKYYALLTQRAERGYLYLLQSREGRVRGSYRDQLARQKHVWLLGHLAQHANLSLFGRLDPILGFASASPPIDRELQEVTRRQTAR